MKDFDSKSQHYFIVITRGTFNRNCVSRSVLIATENLIPYYEKPFCVKKHCQESARVRKYLNLHFGTKISLNRMIFLPIIKPYF